ncbi:MAG TPA: iron-containing alcohol dehydrogenase, partial [Ilumatobacteraceae bacterium]
TVAAAIGASDADLVVAIGGGSVMDTAKMARLVTPGASAADVLQRLRSGTAAAATRIPMIAVPTTLSGAELTAVMGITDDVSREKVVIDIVNGAPDEVVFDPRATVATPAHIWAATGVKCMSDACEELVSNTSSPAIDPLALRALELFRANLGAGPDDLEGRLACQVATWLTIFGIISSGTGAGVAAAIRHQLGAATGLAHGRVAACLLGPVLRYNWPAIPAGLRARLAAALGVTAVPAAVDDVVDEVNRFMHSLDIGGPPDVAVAPGQLAAIAEHALHEFAVKSNPRRVQSAAELQAIVEEALGAASTR